MLALKLTDGRASCKAIEFKPTPALSADGLPPGTKLCVSDIVVSGGILLLTPKCVKVWYLQTRLAYRSVNQVSLLALGSASLLVPVLVIGPTSEGWPNAA